MPRTSRRPSACYVSASRRRNGSVSNLIPTVSMGNSVLRECVALSRCFWRWSLLNHVPTFAEVVRLSEDRTSRGSEWENLPNWFTCWGTLTRKCTFTFLECQRIDLKNFFSTYRLCCCPEKWPNRQTFWTDQSQSSTLTLPHVDATHSQG